MKINEAIKKCQDLIDSGAGRSKVCSFINQLEAARPKLINRQTADKLVEVLEMDRFNTYPVLKTLSGILIKKQEEEGGGND